ncbi:MAG: SEC-C metal-binding domain-containing protein [Cyclobacteriaceae bacterium]|nr:SEC-C metal-binding domain-containing protein [Cyclobacteriaceae bacterium]
MKKVGRNEPCPCGSGKKYKNCHQQMEENSTGKNKAFLYLLLFIAFLIVAIVGTYLNSKSKGPLSSPVPVTAPAGKVWSEEHGHYH